MVSNAIDGLGGLDILINNAGTAATTEPIPFENLEMITEERWQQIIHTNVIGPFRCSRMAASTLKERKGCIVNTASIAGIGNAGSSIAYSNSKAAIISQTRCLARALAPEIRVNAVAPGLTRMPGQIHGMTRESKCPSRHHFLNEWSNQKTLLRACYFLS